MKTNLALAVVSLLVLAEPILASVDISAASARPERQGHSSDTKAGNAGSAAPELRTAPNEARHLIAQAMSNVCYTPVNYCFMPGYAPVGTPCWCPSPYGPINGMVR